MKPLRDESVLIVDGGLFTDLATRLAYENGREDGFGRVGYCVPTWNNARPIINQREIGSQLPGVTHEPCLWKAIDNYSYLCFPDVNQGDFQVWLRERGYKVFGSGLGEEIEIYRWFSKQLIRALGLPVQPVRLIRGIENLIAYLKDNPEKHVKTSVLRGMMDSWKHKKLWQSLPRLIELWHRLGPLAAEFEFIVEDPIKTKLELGADRLFTGGSFGNRGVHGIEIKDDAFAAIVQDDSELTDELLTVNKALTPVLAKYGYNCWLSTEVRAYEKDEDKFFLIDITARRPAPGGESQDELIGNLGEVIRGGAQNIHVPPEYIKQYAAQAMIYVDRDSKEWIGVDVPDKVKQWVKLYNHLCRDGHDFIVPQGDDLTDPSSENEVGTVVAIGDSVEEASELCEEYAKEVSGDSLYVKTDALKSATEELELAKELGISVEPAKL